jgi:tRNA(Ile)-lysidine synthase
MAETADAIEAEAGVLLADAVSVDRYGIAWMDRTAFAVAADEVRARVLARLLIAVGGGIYPPRSDRLANLLAVMTAHGQTGSWKRTLAGAVIQARGGRFVFYRELGRSLPEGRPLSPGASVVWDRRFEVIVGPAASAGLTVGALGEAGRREVGATADAAGQGAPAATLAALPAIRSGQNILAVPHFREPGPGLDAAFRCLVADRLRRPPLFPEFPAG